MVRLNRARRLLTTLVASGELPAAPRAAPFSVALIGELEGAAADDGGVISFTHAGEGWSVGHERQREHVELTRLQLAAVMLGSHVARREDAAALPAWLHAALAWRGLTVWRVDTS